MYTKGDWKVGSKTFGGCDCGADIVISSPNGLVAMACTIHEGKVNAEANAHLIAAAPKLYEALVKFKQYVGVIYIDEGNPTIPTYTIDKEFFGIHREALAEAVRK